jgi:hypothetical protein
MIIADSSRLGLAIDQRPGQLGMAMYAGNQIFRYSCLEQWNCVRAHYRVKKYSAHLWIHATENLAFGENKVIFKGGCKSS